MGRTDLDEVKSFKESQARENAFEYKDRGIRPVPLDKIVGSVGRYHDFDRRFRPKEHVPTERLDLIKAAMRAGKALSPAELYQIKEEYYVVDGNHRISAAKELGWTQIDARIVEFIPGRDTLENLIYREKSAFQDETGLSHDIPLTELGQYIHLKRQILAHQSHLERAGGAAVPVEKAAEDWYKTIYTPLRTLIEKSDLQRFFPHRTLADLYAYISYHHWGDGEGRHYGVGIRDRVPGDMEAFREKMAGLSAGEYPEMRRGITAFVLMHVKANRENRVVERLFEMPEVQEVHSVHGATWISWSRSYWNGISSHRTRK